MKFIKDFKDGDRVFDIYLCKHKQSAVPEQLGAQGGAEGTCLHPLRTLRVRVSHAPDAAVGEQGTAAGRGCEKTAETAC